jgi:hypothetical protein
VDFAEEVLELCVQHGLIKTEDIPNDDPSGQAELVCQAIERLVQTPKVAITMDGGLIQNVVATQEVGVVIIDYDTRDGDAWEATQVPQGEYDGVPQYDLAYVSHLQVEVMPERTTELHALPSTFPKSPACE